MKRIHFQSEALLRACDRVGGQTALAKMLNISASRINKWINNGIKIPYKFAIAIENVTNGYVRQEELICLRLTDSISFSHLLERITTLENQITSIKSHLNLL